MKALGNVLLKVVTAPFSFLTGGGDNLDRIEVDPLQFSSIRINTPRWIRWPTYCATSPKCR